MLRLTVNRGQGRILLSILENSHGTNQSGSNGELMKLLPYTDIVPLNIYWGGRRDLKQKSRRDFFFKYQGLDAIYTDGYKSESGVVFAAVRRKKTS